MARSIPIYLDFCPKRSREADGHSALSLLFSLYQSEDQIYQTMASNPIILADCYSASPYYWNSIEFAMRNGQVVTNSV